MPLNIGAVHRAWQTHLGDLWSSVNAMLRLSEQNGGKFARLSRWTYTDLALKGWEDIGSTLQRIVGLLDAPGSVAIVDEKPTLDLWAPEVWNHRYYPTKITWPGRISEGAPKQAYQWDGRYNGHLNNPPDEHIALFREKYPHAVRLGLPLRLDEIVYHLSVADVFFGIDSGVAHVARSVGTPMFLCEYRGNLDFTQKLPGYIRCRDIPDALEQYGK